MSARSTAMHQRMWFQMGTMLLAVSMFEIVTAFWAIEQLVLELGR